MTIFVTALIFIIIVLALLVGIAFYLQIRHVTTPYRNQNIGTLSHPYQDVTLTTADNLTLSGWYVPGTRPEAIILVHGIHANRAYLIPQAEILAEAGYRILLIDLRGHGYSEGSTMTYGYREALDVQAAVDYLAALPEVEHIGALGHSLGAAAVVRAAATDERLEAIVIQSSYSSLSRAVEENFQNFSVFPRRPFAPLIIKLGELMTGVEVGQVDSARELATMPARPVLIVHSVDDNLFPPQHAEEMYRAAQEPKRLWLVEGLPHVNPITGHETEYRAILLDFFQEAFGGQEQLLPQSLGRTN
ncbi:MAG: alpha/beta fold hydrolase [Anaerolineae bacterium]|nr:alpha/beta fold hydrolase [Anaerolineae bacterium]